MTIGLEARNFRHRKQQEIEAAKSTAAFFLSTGIDLGEALAAPAERQSQIMLRVERILERERLRGQRRHWSYDLNRHIALKDALDRLRRDHKKKKAAPVGTANLLPIIACAR